MGPVVAAIIVAGLLAILTDWLFMGVLFREAYKSYPEVWWPGVRDGETRTAMIWATILGFVMSAGVVALCAVAGVTTVWGGLGVGFLAFVAGPPAVLLISVMFVKMDAWVVLGHTLAYLARMLIAGVAAGLILPLS